MAPQQIDIPAILRHVLRDSTDGHDGINILPTFQEYFDTCCVTPPKDDKCKRVGLPSTTYCGHFIENNCRPREGNGVYLPRMPVPSQSVSLCHMSSICHMGRGCRIVPVTKCK